MLRHRSSLLDIPVHTSLQLMVSSSDTSSHNSALTWMKITKDMIQSVKNTKKLDSKMKQSNCTPVWHMPRRYSPCQLRRYRELGQLDPSLYQDNDDADELYELPPGHLGRLWFEVKYQPDEEQLTVSVIKARNLRFHRDLGGIGAGDSYVKLFMEQDERRFHVTSVKKKTHQPNFKETFCFQVAQDELQSKTLILSVFDIDKNKRHRLVGTVFYQLNGLEVFSRNFLVFRDLNRGSNIKVADNPEIMVALTYFKNQERISVGIYECKNISMRENGSIPDVYVKISLHHGLHSKETKSKYTDLLSSKLAFNESFSFHKITDLNKTNIRLTIVQYNSVIRLFDKPLGFIVFGSDMFSRRAELEHWRTMVEHHDQQTTQWHQVQLLTS